MLSLQPITSRFRNLLGLGRVQLAAAAADSWEIAPAESIHVPPAIVLPGHIERISRTEFASLETVVQSLAGRPAERVGPTMGFRLRDVDIVDGVVYSRGLSLHLRTRKRRIPLPRRLETHASGSLYETWVGNRWFGNWLLNDCLTYRLAEDAGSPVATKADRGVHVQRYEDLLGIISERFTDAHFDELFVFDDEANNSHRMGRAQDLRARLLRGSTPPRHPGVFLLRGRSGDLRLMENEQEIASRLEAGYGLRVIFAEDLSVDQLMEACGGARVVAGIEGSQLCHGVAAMPQGSTLLAIQPPDRVTTALKILTDRWQQNFAMVVARQGTQSFRCEWDDIVRIMDEIEKNRQ